MTIKTSYQAGEPSWADLATPDIDATLAFYSGLFGWEAFESQGEEFGGYRRLHIGGKSVAGVMPLMSPEQPAVWSCYVSTDDADKVAALVSEAGGMTYAPPMDVAELGRMAVFADPTGAAFGVWQAGTFIGTELVETEGTLQWIELSTRDQKAALAFYTDLFGWQTHVSPEYTEFQLGGTSVAGCMDMPEMVPAEVPNYWMPYFNASDPQSQADKAASLGGTIVVPAQSMAEVTFAVVQDPHGSTFGLLRVL